MLIRKNTKAFKSILEIVAGCRDRPDREQLIRLYITKAGDTVNDRISIEGIQGGAGLFYEMNYQAVLGNLKSPNHQLQQSDDVPGLYYFHSRSNKVWDETPFEFDEAIAKIFNTVAELPVFRKREKAKKFEFPAAGVKATTPSRKKGDATKKDVPEEKAPAKDRSAKVVPMWPAQPDYKLKQTIHFTGLERIVIRPAGLSKKGVLDYYNAMAEYLLPHLKDRPVAVRLYRDGHAERLIRTPVELIQYTAEEIPDWIKTAPVGKGKAAGEVLLCNDREHLLFYVQIGCLEFHAGHSRIKSFGAPDYLVLAVESPDYEMKKAQDVAVAVKAILDGLGLPSSLKTDGVSGLHVYVPLDSKSDFSLTAQAAEYLCKLVRLKIPEGVALKQREGQSYGRVTLDHQSNAPHGSVIVPYSLTGQAAQVAMPLTWDEFDEMPDEASFNYQDTQDRLRKKGDVFTTLSRRKVDAGALLERLEDHYAFLF